MTIIRSFVRAGIGLYCVSCVLCGVIVSYLYLSADQGGVSAVQNFGTDVANRVPDGPLTPVVPWLPWILFPGLVIAVVVIACAYVFYGGAAVVSVGGGIVTVLWSKSPTLAFIVGASKLVSFLWAVWRAVWPHRGEIVETSQRLFVFAVMWMYRLTLTPKEERESGRFYKLMLAARASLDHKEERDGRTRARQLKELDGQETLQLSASRTDEERAALKNKFSDLRERVLTGEKK